MSAKDNTLTYCEQKVLEKNKNKDAFDTVVAA